MLIKLSENNVIPPVQFEAVIKECAAKADCLAVVHWTKPQFREIRFRLTDPADNTPATFEQHDQVISMLLMIDRGAEIKTAKAHYHGWEDFHDQYTRSLPGERNDPITS